MDIRYTTKQVDFKAVQLLWDTWDQMCEHANVGYLSNGNPEGKMDGWKIGLLIPTSNGLVTASETDWILKFSDSSLHVCPNEVFQILCEHDDISV